MTQWNKLLEHEEIIKYVTKEIKDSNEQREANVAENEKLRVDGLDKTITILRCVEPIRKARDQMRMYRKEREENDRNRDRMEKEHERKKENMERKLKQMEVEGKTQGKNGKGQINKQSNYIITENKTTTRNRREKVGKAEDVIDENEAMKNSMDITQVEIKN